MTRVIPEGPIEELERLRTDLAAAQERVTELEAQVGTSTDARMWQLAFEACKANETTAVLERDQLRAERDEARAIQGMSGRDKLGRTAGTTGQYAPLGSGGASASSDALFKAKQDDWIEACREVDQLRTELATRDAEVGRLRAALTDIRDDHANEFTSYALAVREVAARALSATPEPAILQAVRTMKGALEKMVEGYVPADHCLDEQCCDACDAVNALADVARVLGEVGV